MASGILRKRRGDAACDVVVVLDDQNLATGQVGRIRHVETSSEKNCGHGRIRIENAFSLLEGKFHSTVRATEFGTDLPRSSELVGDAALDEVAAEPATFGRFAWRRASLRPVKREPGPSTFLERLP